MDFRLKAFAARLRTVGLSVAAAAMLASTGLAAADGAPLVPQTKFRLKIVQWMPVKGAYEQWDALGGEFVVSATGDVALPVVGSVSASKLDNQSFAAEIAALLQKKTGLVSKPDVSVEIVEYPPIYLVGDVTNPGEYKFREGMTILQAMALGGGQRRSSDEMAANNTRLVADLRGQDDEILRSTARIARLEAELDGAEEIKFPRLDDVDVDGGPGQVFEREKFIFKARGEELERQSKSLTELRELFAAEIKVLEEKIKTTDEASKSTQKELEGVMSLVAKGFAPTSRKSEVERLLAGYRADRLDQMTAIMRARQGISEATRSLDGLRDKKMTEVAGELQTTQASLQQARLRRETSQRLLIEALGKANAAFDGDQGSLSFSVVRAEDGNPTKIPGTETTLLQPGDVVNVTFSKGAAREGNPAGSRKSVSQ